MLSIGVYAPLPSFLMERSFGVVCPLPILQSYARVNKPLASFINVCVLKYC
jgi:hypothetical protein